jgi:uncharacterized tellurite resistance protein B-like protein
MKEFNPNWSEQQLIAYTLLYCAKADFVETDEEKVMIASKIAPDVLEGIKAEFNEDNDYEHAQKIMKAMDNLNYTPSKREALIQEILEMFNSDGEFSQVEKTLYRSLKRLL